MDRKTVSLGSRLIVVIAAVLLAASLVAYIGYSAVAMVWSHDALDRCQSHDEWAEGRGEDVGLLNARWSFIPVGIRCRWSIGEEALHEEVISPW